MALETSLDCPKDGAKQSVHMRGIDSVYIVNIRVCKRNAEKIMHLSVICIKSYMFLICFIFKYLKRW